MNRICYLFIICLLFASQGCKTSKKKRVDPSQQKPQVTAPFEMSGQFDFGAISISQQESVVVSFHPVVRGQVSLDDSVSVSEADRDGFTIIVPEEYYLQPGFLKAVFPLEEGGSLHLLRAVRELTPFNSYDMTVLGHLAAEKTLSASSLGSPTQAAVAIADAHGQVASRFGIIGDIAFMSLVDLDSGEAVQQASLASLKYSLLSTAITRAIEQQWPDQAIGQSLAYLSDDYSAWGIAERSEDEVVTLQAVFAQLIEEVVALQQDGERHKPLERLQIELATEYGLYSVSDKDNFEQGAIPTGSGLPYIEKAKGMVQSIRDVVSSLDVLSIVDLGDVSKLLSGESQILNKLEGLGVEVNLSELLDSDEFSDISSALSAIFSASLERLACEKDPACSQAPQSEIDLSYNFQEQGGRGDKWEFYTFDVDQHVDVCPEQVEPCVVEARVQLNIDAHNMSFTADGDIVYFDEALVKIQGEFHRGTMELELSPVEPQLKLGRGSIGLGTGNEPFFIDLQQYSTLNFPFVLSERDANASQTMNAVLDGSVERIELAMEELGTPIYYGQRSTLNKTSITTIDKLQRFQANLQGRVDKPQGEAFLVSMNLAQPGKGFDGELKYTTETVTDCEDYSLPETCIETELATEISGESLEKTDDGFSQFIEMDVSVGYKALLKALTDPALVQFSVSRDSLERATINGLKVSYPGQSLRMNGTFTSKGSIKSIGATNIDGIVMDVNSDNGDRRGTLKAPDGTELAKISPKTDLIHIQFEDGYFVTF